MQKSNPIISFLNSDEFSSGQFHSVMFEKFPYLRETCGEVSKNFVGAWLDVFESMLACCQPHQLKDYREKLEKENPELLEKHKDNVARFEIFISEKISAIFASSFIVGQRLAIEEFKQGEKLSKVKRVDCIECLDCGHKDSLIRSKGDGKISCSKCGSEKIKKWETATGDSGK